MESYDCSTSHAQTQHNNRSIDVVGSLTSVPETVRKLAMMLIVLGDISYRSELIIVIR